jgi:hypothetical protein
MRKAGVRGRLFADMIFIPEYSINVSLTFACGHNTDTTKQGRGRAAARAKQWLRRSRLETIKLSYLELSKPHGPL